MSDAFHAPLYVYTLTIVGHEHASRIAAALISGRHWVACNPWPTRDVSDQWRVSVRQDVAEARRILNHLALRTGSLAPGSTLSPPLATENA